MYYMHKIFNVFYVYSNFEVTSERDSDVMF